MATAQALGFDVAALFGAKKPAIESGAAGTPPLCGTGKEDAAVSAAAGAGDDDFETAAEAGFSEAGSGGIPDFYETPPGGRSLTN